MSPLLPRVIVLAPGGSDGVGVVVAAGRAGALGVLDLAVASPQDTQGALRRAARYSRHAFGAWLEASAVVASQPESWPERLAVVACLGDAATDWAPILGAIRLAGRVALAEVTTRQAAASALAAGADGVILAGHEAGGRCGGESSFVMLQGMLKEGLAPVWVRGGIGPHAASACVAMGAAGVVLDGAVLLARESPLNDEIRTQVGRFDGGETVVLGPETGPCLRVYGPPGALVVARLQEAAGAGGEHWRRAARELVGWSAGQARPLGQDAAQAGELARRYGTVGGIVRAVEESIDRGRELAGSLRPLAPGSPLAVAHGTRYPIVQGPMTRVSDTVEFASAVAEGGALPFLALALLRGAEVRPLLAEASARLGEVPWGVGLLGFAPPELRAEQFEAIRAAQPPFALIAGGRPDQALELERGGTATYLHAPSPGLLAQYLRDGVRRFVLEGRECGGHVGPRSSLVLWEQAISGLLEATHRDRALNPADLHLLFAGGIHDARSAAAVAALAAPLADRGAKIGVLVGTAYLFTREAVATGAIVPRFQAEALRCRETVLLQTAPGHEVRVAPSPFAATFETERRRLLAGGASPEAIRDALERLNAGRLRVATRGLERTDGAASPLVALEEPRQYERGLYMLGQVAALREQLTTIPELHRAISEGATTLLETVEATTSPTEEARPSDIAIVGMSALFPGAADLRTFWENTLQGVDAITEVPPDRWDWRPYYDPDPRAPDRVISKWGGFLPDIPFDPLRYGMPPAALPSIEPVQLLVLEAVRAALDDAGYARRPFPRERTAVVLGMGGGAAQLAMGHAFRSYLPMLEALDPEVGRAARQQAEPLLPGWTEDSFPGFLLNVTAGRVANRFDLGGANYTVDAACGSSLAAASLAVRELETGAADMVVLGGADTVQNPFTYLAFSKTQAFSPRGRCRPFDASADGIVISEGVGVVVLKRLADAERDGDRIYAVIKGIGCSSDGRDRGLTAPNGVGQARALARAYEKAGLSPRTVGYVETHGTGTAVGDVVEVNALADVLRRAGAQPGSCVVGSIKSMIGHTKCAAGLAGLINATLALYHRVLPPTIGVEQLNPKADLRDGPIQVSTATRPWLHNGEWPRRAGVSAFGFGGTNFHAVLESYEGDPTPRTAPMRAWPAELLVWQADDRDGLLRQLDALTTQLDAGARPALRDLAHTLNGRFVPEGPPRPTLALIATTLDDLRAKLATARDAIASGLTELNDPRGVFHAERPAFAGEPVAFLFPGQGAQALEMLGDLALTFEEVRDAFETFDAALIGAGRPAVGPKVFPPPTLDEAGRERARHALMATDAAQPAVGAASVGMLRLLRALGLEPDLLAGHSYGELVALHAAGALEAEALALLSEARGRLMSEAAGPEPGAMAALAADAERAGVLVAECDGVVIANLNGPRQTVIAGTRDAVARAVERARAEGIRAFELPVSCAFHSPEVSGARSPLAQRAAELITAAPARPVFSNLDAAPHPADPAAIAARLGDHLASPVRFAAMIEALHAAGARIFVECGPGAILTPLVGSILGERPHRAIACDAPGRPGIPALLHALGRLIVAGVAPRRLERLTAGRGVRRLDLERLPTGDSPELPPSTWLVNGSRARPLAGPEPRRLGQAPEILGTAPPPAQHPGGAPENDETTALGPREHAASNGHTYHHATIHKPMNNGSSTTGRNGHLPESRPMPDHGPLPTAAPHPASGPLPAPGAARVIESFQETMRAFLQVQQATMLAYLSGRSGAPLAPVSAPETPTLAGPPSPSPAPAAGPAEVPPDPAPSVPQVNIPQIEESTEVPTTVAGPEPVSRAERPRQTIAERLVEIVRDRTGYPTEMLRLDVDLEADLGIDSIKRVEILGTLRDSLDDLGGVADPGLMERLAQARTMGEIVEQVETACSREERSPGAPVANESAAAPAPAPEPFPDGPALRRLVLDVVDAPRPEESTGLVPGSLVLLTDDGRGVARAVARQLRAEGHEVARIGAQDLADADDTAARKLLGRLRRGRPLAGVVHLLPLRASPRADLDPAVWAERLNAELRGLFLLARAAAEDLERAARQGGACLIAATGLGGTFGSASGRALADLFPGHGGVAGLVKTLAREWPAVRARVVDLDPREPAPALADRLLAEIRAEDVWPEVGYIGQRRVRLDVVERPLRTTGPVLDLAPGEPVLVTGGGRGITAAVAEALARRWRPTLLLVGSSPLPPEREDPATAGLSTAAELKAALLAQFRQAGKPVTPAELERAYRALRNAREIRATLNSIRAAGSVVEYARADVRDPNALRAALDAWRRRFGEPVGLIHGAGVIQDKLLRDKSPASFDRVLSTKLDGALNLARSLRGDALRFTALFSSIAGRFGNPGQSDYAAANEALNKLALWLDQHWPGRVVSVNWGPWAGVGMVSEIEAHLGRRGLGMIAPEAGCAGLIDELRHGRKGEVEVILAGDLGELAGPLPTTGVRELAGAAR